MFEAEHVDPPNEYVAIKLIAPESADQPQWRRRAEQEAEIALGLVHPNIVRAHAHGWLSGGASYLVMELLEGETLAQRLAMGRGLGRREGARLCEQLGAALAAVHARGVVHRDVKPANIFLTEGADTRASTTKLMDFGLAKGPVAMTNSMERLGTLAYMAPELILSGARDACAATDIYAMALSCFEALSGQRAFSDRSIADLVGHICYGAPPDRVDALRPDLSSRVAELIARGLDRDASRRPRDAAAYGHALAVSLRA
ncbi:MAG: serine/threonine protein kinase [Myxococcales bacterium]|nr:serine/threonine protein kinase [Myxococcales bacterium]